MTDGAIKDKRTIRRVSGAWWKRFTAMLDRHSGRISGSLVFPGDVLNVLSGLDFNNWGRIFGSVVGLLDNVGQIIWGDKPRAVKDEDGHKEEPQDLSWFRRSIRYWQFWKYPWEFSGTVAIVQGLSAMLLAGPDTASLVGDAVNVEKMVSQEQGMRLSEVFSGATLLVGCAIMYVREESHKVVEAAGRKHLGAFGVTKEFKACAGYFKNRYQDIKEHGWRPGTLKAMWDGTIKDISYAGPNAVAARWFQVALPYMAHEAVLLEDWNMFGAACLFMVSNAFLANSTKRIDTHADDAASPLT